MTMMPEFPDCAPREEFIAAMRGVASSVTVVTTDGPAGRHGATVSAFTSLSADPPSVLICLRAESRIARAVTQNGQYCVNVLSEDQSDLAERFAGLSDTTTPDRFAGLELVPTRADCPALVDATVFHCQLDKKIPYGSHLILIGRVTRVLGEKTAPLAWMDGRFHRVHPQ